jgi:DNA-binding NarL/FixJ family response regulator
MKILIADPQPKVRRALSIWINRQPGWEVAGEAGSSFDLLDKLDELSPGVVILDRDLPGLPPEELVKRVRRASRGVVIILLTSGPLERCQTDVLEVDFFVSKVDPPNRMLDVIWKALGRQESKTSSRASFDQGDSK